ncbi:storkhead-box protein 2 isoform X1 [Osmerus eperlanus]|uniref:storkhead-box protein 2 isoform X1 n=1 Tax=Osmerus eperlanus TaxID=29151 RepID=UPI002E0DAB0A
METFLQIAPHSLALVMSRIGAKEDSPATTQKHHHHMGYEIFADFKAVNMEQFWNKKVTDAIKDTFFLGWIDEHVLLIQGKEDHLEVLREAWSRRALKPPAGFDIKFIGDVSPISMSPISQSQFIPLGDILCLAISAMNSAHKPVTHDALMEHLTTSFPGVPTPSSEILRHTLNMLVRERKIFPSPEGYFIVTPQTYFITPSLIRSNSKWYHLDDRLPDWQQQQQHCTSPQSGTITPSTPGCTIERPSRKNHNETHTSHQDDPPKGHTSGLQSKVHKEPRGDPPSYPQPPPPPTTPPVQASPQTPPDKNKANAPFSYKMDTLTKKKDGSGGSVGGSISEKQSKKFGLRLFRLSFKKDKMRQLATFSAQFPPEEWPLRDEDMPLASIPREVEMEIIRRINPDLTVENVARHTAVMKRLEEERVQRNKAGSAAQHSSRSRRGRGHRRVPHGKSRSHSKTRPSRGDPSDISNLDFAIRDRDYRFFSHSLVRSPREAMYTLERRRSREGVYLVHSNPNITDSHCSVTPEWDVSGELAKRRTEMPFPEPSHGTSHSRVHRSHSHNLDRKSRNERTDQAKERSRSMDNSLGPLGGVAVSLGRYDSPDERNRYCTDDGTLRATKKSSHYSRIMFTAAKYNSEFSVPDIGNRSLDEARIRTTLERNKSRDSLPAYSDLKGLSPKPLADDYFQCNTSNETILTAPSPQAKSEHDTLTSTKGLRKGSPADRRTPHLTSPHTMEYKEELSTKGQNGSMRPTPSQTPEPNPNVRLTPHLHNVDPGGGASCVVDKRKEIFSKDTLFKPPHSSLPPSYVESSCYTKSGTLRKAPHFKSTEALDNLDPQQPSNTAADPLSAVMPQGSESKAPSASFDYYNVSDDEEAEDNLCKEVAAAEDKDRAEVGGGGGGGTGGTMKWLLEREKEHLQRKLETNLTLLSPKETENSSSQKSAHSARLDSMDSSSVTVDSGFNSPRTRESLASNTSSIVESNRRQNPVLSPGHIGSTSIGLPFSFPSIPEPPTNPQPEKLQKSSNCLASITSV